MPLFCVRRHFPGASERDLDAAASRSLSCVVWFDGMRWLRSYWDAASEETLCIYEARSKGDIVAHAERSQIPCNEISEVTEILPERFEMSAATDSLPA